MTVAAKLTDVARLAGVSSGTVSNVLNHPEIVSLAVQETVQAAIESLGYVRNDVARQLRAKDSRTLVFLTSQWDDPFIADMIRGAETRAFEKGMCLTVCPVGGIPENELTHINHLMEQRVRGVIVAATANPLFTAAALRARNILPVLVALEGPERGESLSISFDHFAAGFLAATHLADGNRRRITYIGTATPDRCEEPLLLGCHAALTLRKIHFEILHIAATTGEEAHRVGLAIASRQPRSRSDAIIVTSELVAHQIRRTLRNNALRVPEDIAITVCTTNHSTQGSSTSFPTVIYPGTLFGQAAIDLLVNYTNSPTEISQRHITLAPQLSAGSGC